LKPQVVNAHYASGTETFAAALSRYHPFVISVWGSDIARDPEKSYVFKKTVTYVLKHADVVHTGDEFGKERLQQLGCRNDQIFINPLGVELKLFTSKIPGEKTSKYVILNANKWEPEHHVDVLIKAVSQVVKEITDITCVLLGGGPQERELKALAKTLGIEHHIVFIGRIPHEEMPENLAGADILVDTDIIGNNAGAGIGVTNMEAMVCGIPILLSEREYLRNVGKSLRDESWYCSLIYEPGDSNDLSKKLLILLKDESLRKKIGDKEMKIAREIGDWNKNMEKIEQIMLNKRL
jgi:glycosyltransferase involved in cell wall biosynthesis